MSRPWHERLAAPFAAADRILLGVLITGMVLLAGAQIILRNFFGTGLIGADSALGVALLWLTMFGALAATDARKHISIDLVSQLLPPCGRATVAALTDLFAAVVCAALVVPAVRFALLQREMSLPPLFGLSQWTFYLVVPAGFVLMAVRFLLHAIVFAQQAATRAAPAEPA